MSYLDIISGWEFENEIDYKKTLGRYMKSNESIRAFYLMNGKIQGSCESCRLGSLIRELTKCKYRNNNGFVAYKSVEEAIKDIENLPRGLCIVLLSHKYRFDVEKDCHNWFNIALFNTHE